MLAAYRGEYGGRDPATAYRRFVEGGVAAPPPSPFREAFGGWVLGSDRFAARVRALAEADGVDPPAPEVRQLGALGSDASRICLAVATYYGVAVSELTRRHAHETARSVAAWLCRRHTEAPLRELAELLGLSRADSVPNLTRRVDRLLPSSSALAADIEAITRQMSAELPLGTTGQRARKTKNHA